MKRLYNREKKLKFMKSFASSFGKLTDDDGVNVYLDWVSTVNVEILVKVMESMSGKYKGKPRLGTLRRWYDESLLKQKKTDESRRLTGSEITKRCTKCKGNGFGWVTINGEDYRWVCPDCPAEVNGRSMTEKIHGHIPTATYNNVQEYFRNLIEGWKYWRADK